MNTEKKLWKRKLCALLNGHYGRQVLMTTIVGTILQSSEVHAHMRTLSAETHTSKFSLFPRVSVSGKVVDSQQRPLQGATVHVKGTQIRVATDANGEFLLNDITDDAVLLVSFSGKKPKELMVKGQGKIQILLEDDVVGLEEVTAIGYVSLKKKDMTGAVSSLSKEQITRIPANDLRSALVFVPGVRVSNGQIRIRGNRSVHASNEPLIILDGIPYYEGIQAIDLNDIESMEILKDASSTALYGSQGANGVIVVNTKKGKVGATDIYYDAFAGFAVTDWRNFEVMNADEYTRFLREAYRAAGTWKTEADDSKIFLGNEIANMGTVDEDWVGRYLGKNRFWTSQTLTLSAGKEKTQHKISFNYKNDNGRLKGANRDNFTLTADVDHQVFDKLKIGLSTRLFYYKGYNKPDPLGGLINMSPLVPIYGEDGMLNITPTGDPFVKNPFLNENDDFYLDKSEEWKTFLRFYANVNIAEGLTFKTNFSYNPAFSARGYYYDNRSTGYHDVRNVAGNENRRQMGLVWNNILNYKRSFSDKHELDLTAVFELQNNTRNSALMSGKDQELPLYLWHNMGRLMDSKTLSSGFSRSQMLSYVGRAQYSFLGRYLATVSVRQDGASQLSDENKWQLFDSYALGWRISDEELFKELSFVDNLKLRVSYGTTGNHSIAPYATLGSLHSSYATFYNPTGEVHYVGLEASVRPTPGLKWERNRMLNIGLDYAFLKGRISGVFDYYMSKTDNLLNQRKLPYTSGFNYAWENIGKTQNQGFELTLNTKPLQKDDYELGLNFTAYRNKEKLVELYDPKLVADIQNRWWIDYPINGVHYDLEYLGIWQENEAGIAELYGQRPGEIRVRDRDGNGVIDGEDRVILGTDRPEWSGSVQLTGHWKGFDIAMDLYGEFGAMVFDNLSTSTWANQMGRWNTVKVDYWTPENPENLHPRPIAGQGARYINAIGYKDNDFVTLRNVTVGYTLGTQAMGKFVKRARFYLTSNDPYRYMQFSRQRGISFGERVFLVGANIQF